MHDGKQLSVAGGRIAIDSNHIEARSETDALRAARSIDKMADCESWYLGRLMGRIARQR